MSDDRELQILSKDNRTNIIYGKGVMKSIACLTVAFACCVLFNSASFAQRKAPPSPADNLRKTGPTQKSEQAAQPSNNLDAEFADTLRRLIRLRLDRALQINAKVPGTYSDDDLETIKAELKALDVQDSRDGEAVSWFPLMIGLSQISKTVADAEWKRVSDLRARTGNSPSELDVEMSRLRARLADLNLQRGKLAAKGTAEERQNWALLYFAMEIQGLKDQVRGLEERE